MRSRAGCGGEEGTAPALSLQWPSEETRTKVTGTTSEGRGSCHFSPRGHGEEHSSLWTGSGKLHCTSPERKVNTTGWSLKSLNNWNAFGTRTVKRTGSESTDCPKGWMGARKAWTQIRLLRKNTKNVTYFVKDWFVQAKLMYCLEVIYRRCKEKVKAVSINRIK